MRCWAVTVTLGGREFEIPALPAVDWWPVLTGMNPASLLDFLKSDEDLDGLLLDGTISGDELSEAWRDTVEEVTGRSFHAAFVLATVAAMHWPIIGGDLARRGFRWDVAPIGAALDAVYATIVEPMTPAALDKFTVLLENESLTRPGRKRVPSERVMTEFESMAGPRPAPAPLPDGANAELSGSQRPRTRIRPRPTHQDDRPGQPTPRPAGRGKSAPAASSAPRKGEA
jgi:hypothetical protein